MITKFQVKYIQSLNQKKLRQEIGVFVAEGPKIVSELLEAGHIDTLEIFALKEWLDEYGKDINKSVTKVWEITEAELQRISFQITPHHVLGVFKQPQFKNPINIDQGIAILLDGIQDPGNMGTIIRIADWFSIDEIIASVDSADVFNPKVVQSTMGSIARVRVTYFDLKEFILINKRVPVYAASLHGKPLHEFGKLSNGMLLIGNESKGISDSLLETFTHKITIPKFGHAESLNAAVATGIILSHIK